MARGKRLWRTAIAAVAVGVLQGACAVGPADANVRSRVFSGLNLTDYNDAQPPDVARMARAGVRRLRFSFTWFGVEGQQGTYDWSQLDRLVGDLASQDIRSEPVLFGTPRWAVGNLPPDPTGAGPTGNGTAYPPVVNHGAIQGWERFVRAAVARYGPSGTYWTYMYPFQHPGSAPLPITTWQVWNEPTVSSGLWPRPSVHRYGKLVKITSTAITSVDPNARVALAGVPGHVRYRGIKFINRLYRDFPKLNRYFDLIAFHPYAPTAGSAVKQLVVLRRALRRDHDPRVRLWVSEIGWGSARGGTKLNRGRAGQARQLTKLFTALRRRHRALRLWQVTWFDYHDPRQTSSLCDWCVRSGLIDWRGHRKPAWDAYRTFMGTSR